MTFSTIDHRIQQALRDTRESEYATLTGAGQPVSNPLFHYYAHGARTIDIATGLAYPAKANRVRGNPKVGLLLGPAVHAHDPMAIIEAGTPDTRKLDGQPVLVVAAMGAVRDRDLQANTDRYVKLFLEEHPKIGPSDWDTMKQMTNYWVRIWVECAPAIIYYWPSGRLDDEEPIVWRAPQGTEFPSSDPAPSAARSKPARWPAEPWQQRAELVLQKFPTPVLTLANEEGFPIPFPTRSADLTDGGFVVTVPKHRPWEPAGPGSLSFGAYATFLGEVAPTVDGLLFRVNRLIGNLPSVFDNASPEARVMAERLAMELAHRGQAMPVIRKPD
jgi:hypothetical protein